MALDLGVLQGIDPVSAFYKGQEDVAQNALARQQAAQTQEVNALRRQEAELGLQRSRNLLASEQEQAINAKRAEKTAMFRDRLLRARTPADARTIVTQQYADPDVGSYLSQFAPVEQALKEVPDDPNEFQTYVQQEAMGMTEWLKSQMPKVVGGSVYYPPTGKFATPEKPSNKLIPVLIGGQPTLVPEEQAVGMTPATAQTIRRMGAGVAPSAGGARAAAPKVEAGVAAPAGKPMTELQQRKVKQEQVQDFQSVRAAQTVANELEKLTDELAGNEEKGIPQHPGYSRIVGFGAMTPTLPGGDAARAEQKLESFKGKIATFGRQLATEFGKLGNMAVAEWKIISDSVENINPKAGNLDDQMRNVVRLARDFQARQQEKYNMLHGDEAQQPNAPAQPSTRSSRTVTRTGTLNGRKVVQYSDGSVEYAD